MNPFLGYEQEDPFDSARYALMVGDRVTAKAVLEAAAGSGRPSVLCLLADLILESSAGPQDEARAEELREEAFLGAQRTALAGDPEAQCWLWRMHRTGRGAPPDPAQAARWRRAFLAGLRETAERGDGMAQYRLGGLYWDGEAVKRDRLEADFWYRQAIRTLPAGAGLKDGSAEYAMGVLCLTGRGGERSRDRAAEWFRKAAGYGDPDTICKAGGLFFKGRGRWRGRKAEAARLLEAAAAGCIPACRRLGLLCWDGTRDAKARNRARAAAWYAKASEAGDGFSAFMMGRIHIHGLDGSTDLAEAARWLALAHRLRAGGGCGDFRKLLYALGHGEPSDVVEAYHWWQDLRAPAGMPARRFRPVVLPSRSTPEEQRLLSAMDLGGACRRARFHVLKLCRGAVPRNGAMDFIVELMDDGWRDDPSLRSRLARRLLELPCIAGRGRPPERLPDWALEAVAQAIPYFHRIAWRAQQEAEEMAFVRSAIGTAATSRKPTIELGFLSAVRRALAERMRHLRQNVDVYRFQYESFFSGPPCGLSPEELAALGAAWVVIGCAFVALQPERSYRLEYWLGWEHCEPGWARQTFDDGALTGMQMTAVLRAYPFGGGISRDAGASERDGR